MLLTRVLAATVSLITVILTANPVMAAGKCLAMAENAPAGLKPYIRLASLKADEVEITYVGHSTFRITTPEGVVIVTDYAGDPGEGPTPNVATMNYAHESHYTDYPDPAIAHILRGWNPMGGPIDHNLTVKDVSIRNVSTDIRSWSGTRMQDGNSIFIFEVADLCIGHLGHLHHELSPAHLGWIGYLDVVMVPVDGGFTMEQAAMVRVLKDIRARLILPMHYFGDATLGRFLAQMPKEFEVELNPTPTITLSVDRIPRSPKILVLPGY